MKEIDWGFFPEPYDRELPFYIGQAYERLTPDGAGLLDIVVESLRRPVATLAGGGEGEEPSEAAELLDTEGLERRFAALPEWDFQAVVAINKHAKRAMEALMDRVSGEADLSRQMLGLFRRAGELEPAFAARVERDEATVEEAIFVLKRHGIKPGVSEEVLDMAFEVRPDGSMGRFIH